MSKKSIKAAYGPIMLNANVVNTKSRCPIPVKLRKNLLDLIRFPSPKTTVKYNLRFFVNAGTVHFAGGRRAARDKITRNINAI